MESILDSLNPEQREAVTLTEGPLLVIAGAGSGKTRVITHRIAHLVRELNVPPWGIFAATFTNKAAGEMRHRVGAMLPGYETARLTVATFHSICVSILRREASAAGLGPRFTIADDTDQLALIKDCLRDLDIPNSRIKPEEIRNWIAKAKLHAASAAEVRAAVCRTGAPENAAALYAPEELREALAAELIEDRMNVFSAYESRLAQSNAVDFDDLLIKVVRLFRERVDILRLYQDRWHYLLVDEYQDTNRVQCELVRLLAGERRNLCVVGDEDQSIYSWRGAEIENILNFPNEYPGTRIVRLEQNYRSRQTILHAAEAVIEHNTQRHGKKLWSERGEGEPITLIEGMSERDEAAQVVETIRRLHDQAGVPYRDIAVFYRINALSRLFEDFLRESKINYRVIGGVRFYDRMEIKDLLAYLKLIVNPVDGLSLTRIVNKPRRGIGDKTLTRLFNEASKKGVSLWQQMMSASGDEEIPKKSRAGIADLLAKIDRWRDLSQNRTPVELLDAVLRDTGYEESLGSERDLETLSRLENIGEL
ncbi:UvrD-helicase domain-containing protein, partial [Candidatus Sumerlaeota bacterium]|nr:UvrD-helicase domain-containing protein [Candidatus Sumerlaeota bacterium]